jgi:hypothetical protein
LKPRWERIDCEQVDCEGVMAVPLVELLVGQLLMSLV